MHAEVYVFEKKSGRIILRAYSVQYFMQLMSNLIFYESVKLLSSRVMWQIHSFLSFYFYSLRGKINSKAVLWN